MTDLETIISKYESMIGKVVRRYAGSRSAATDPDDLYQAALIAIGQEAPKHDSDKGDLTTGIWIVSKSAVIKEIQKYKWEKYNTKKDKTLEPLYEDSMRSKVDDRELDSYLSLNESLKKLDAEQKRLVVAKLAGYTHAEIGEGYGVTRQSITGRFKTIERKLREE